ncbi:MAG: sugar transferase [Cyclobacteriaceae bacterium]
MFEHFAFCFKLSSSTLNFLPLSLMNYKSLKPMFDYLLIFIFLLPILLMTFLILLGYVIQGQFPILFSQPRVGKNGKPFIMHKFRTLSTDTTQSLTARRFSWGNFLRVTNLDELPQLWNVLRGEMSLVGPRPLPVEYANLFSAEQNKRHQALPGLTGLAQVSGKNDLPWPEKFKCDLEYINRYSLWLDLTILFKTFLLALSFKQDTSLNEEKFPG